MAYNGDGNPLRFPRSSRRPNTRKKLPAASLARSRRGWCSRCCRRHSAPTRQRSSSIRPASSWRAARRPTADSRAGRLSLTRTAGWPATEAEPFRQGPDEGGPFGGLHGALHRQEHRRRGTRAAGRGADRVRDRPPGAGLGAGGYLRYREGGRHGHRARRPRGLRVDSRGDHRALRPAPAHLREHREGWPFRARRTRGSPGRVPIARQRWSPPSAGRHEFAAG